MRISSVRAAIGVIILSFGALGCTSGSGSDAGNGTVGRTIGELRLMSEKMRNQAARALVGDTAQYTALDATGMRFARSLAQLKEFWPENAGIDLKEAFGEVDLLRRESETLITLVNENREVVKKWQSANDRMADLTNELMEAADELAMAIVKENASQEQVYLATRQLMLLERLRAQSLEARLGRGEDVVKAIDRLGRDAKLLRRVSDGFVAGDAGLRLTKLEAPEPNKDAKRLAEKMKMLESVVMEVMQSAPDAFRAREALVNLEQKMESVGQSLETLQAQYPAAAE